MLTKRLKRWLMLNLGPFLTWAFAQFAGKTSKLVVIDGEKVLAMLYKEQPFIAALWHNRALIMPFIVRALGCKTFLVMVSGSDDGIFTQRVLKKFGINSAVGSSTRGGKEAFQEMVSAHKKEGVALAITPDGPRGPHLVVKPGIVLLAKETGLPIISLSYYAKKVKRLNSWDKFIVVWPFNTISAIAGEEPIYVPANATDEELEFYRKRVEDDLNRISSFVENYSSGKASLQGRNYFYSKAGCLRRITSWTRPDGSVFTTQDLAGEKSKPNP